MDGIKVKRAEEWFIPSSESELQPMSKLVLLHPCVAEFHSYRIIKWNLMPRDSLYRVRTGPGKPGKSWNLIIWIPGLESHGILDQVLESHGISCCQICMQQSCLLFWIV